MYNELYIHLAEHNILYSEPFGLVFGNVENVDEITNSFMEIENTIGVFIDLWEGFWHCKSVNFNRKTRDVCC